MCGIAGLIYREPSIDYIDLADLKEAIDTIAYRGPDGWGIWKDENAALGHRRLSIIDLSDTGRQPMVDSNSGIVVTFNGEIYNYQSLKHELQACGYRFQSTSDTEVLIHAYHCFGTDFISRLRGMFAFCLYDPRHQKIIMARDRMGKKPLYYCLDHDRLIFASEIKAFHAFKNVDFKIDRESIKSYLVLQFIPGPHTIYKNVYRLPQGNFLELNLATWHSTIHPYWSLIDTLTHDHDDVGLQEIDEKLADSIRLRLIADVEVGLMLSGGIDSSLISWYVADQNSQVRAFTASFERDDLDETSYAKLVAQHLNINLVVTPGGLLTPDAFEKIIFHMDEPLGDPACVPTFLLAQAFSKYVKVILSGEGADELFLGYPHYFYEEYWPVINPFQPLLKHILPPELASRWEKQETLPPSIVRGAKAISASQNLGAMRWTTVFSENSAARLTGSDMHFPYLLEMNDTYQALRAQHGHLKASAALDLLYWLPDDLLIKIDRMTMAHGVEARAPFLDQELIAQVLNIPPQKMRKFKQTKIVLKSLVSKKFTSPIRETLINRPKHGLETNTAEWMKGSLREMAEERFSSSASSSPGLLDTKEANSFWQSFVKADVQSPLRRKAWLMFVLQSWNVWHTRKFARN